MEKNEQKEREYLGEIKKRLQAEYDEIVVKIEQSKEEIKEDTIYLGEARTDMDHAEKITVRQLIEAKVVSAEHAIAQRKKLSKLIESPYFGRFDFKAEGEARLKKIYIGIHHFYDIGAGESLIYDWRAPISSMFYNHEIGQADYEAPSGQISGEVLLKRQFRIRKGEMEFMLESSMNIMDDVLQKELSRASDDGMKNIVATIQRDQNAIIRDENTQVLIIQGVAGSGKTSIALHRIAFLLYRFKETLTAEDILIISPNKVFSDYISNVLPELGEEAVGEIQMETLVRELLGSQFRFQTFFEQTADLLERDDENSKERIKIKSSAEFLETLNKYADHLKKDLFSGKDVNVGGCFVPAWLFDEIFQDNSGLSKERSIKEVTEVIKKKIGLEHNYVLQADETAELKKKVAQMHKGLSLRAAYIAMFDWMGKPGLFKLASESCFEYADVFPLIYLKMLLEGKEIDNRKAKHLLIDEMQDYTPVQYAVIARLFNCNKTILGDANQSVNPYSSSNAETIKNAFVGSSYVKLNKSYRSTYEIMEFVQRISPNPDLEVMKRHGEVPRVLGFKTDSEELGEIIRSATTLATSGFNTLGIICKTQKQAEMIRAGIKRAGVEAHFLTGESDVFRQGVIVCTAHMAKGLEFDEVIVPGVSAQNYSTLMDKSLLYVACTRAMHSLILTHTGALTKLICG